MPNQRKPTKVTVRKKGKKAPAVAAPASLPPWATFIRKDWLLYFLAAWLLVMAGLFSLPNYRQLLPPEYPLDHLPTRWLIVGGFLLMAALWRFLPEGKGEDLTPRVARFWFWVFLALGAALRLYRPEEPPNFFWDDHYVVVSDIRNILDDHIRPLLFPFGWREPLYPYLSAFLWVLVPKATGVFITRLSSTAIDLVTIWLFYLLGKEVSGRRMGILLMAMGAISKEMIMICKFAYGSGTTVLACALALLFFLRAVKKPDVLHFLEWGVALGFGAYSYVPFRVWTPVILGCLWLWVFSDPRERKWDPFRLVLGPGLLMAWAFLFLYKNLLLPAQAPGVDFLTSTPALVVVAALLGFSYWKVALQGDILKMGKLGGWATGAFATALMMAPLYLHPHYAEHVSDIFSAFSDSAQKAGPFWGRVSYLWGHFIMGQYFMFGKFDDVGRLPAAGDSFFDYYAAACGLLGLAYFAARPSWLKAFVVTMYLVGMVPYMFTFNPHPFRLEAAVVPILLTGAWGLDRFWGAGLQVNPSRNTNRLFAVFLLLFCGWEVDRNSRLLAVWMSQKGPDSTAMAVVGEFWPADRVYLRPNRPVFYTASQDILCDNRDVYRMNDSNVIELAPGEKGKDLAVLVSGKDTAIQQKLEQSYPGLTWFKRYIYWEDQVGVPFLMGTIIPFEKIAKDPGGLFTVRQAQPGDWLRHFYGRYGMGRGLILHSDLVTHWNDTPPQTKPENYEWDHATATVEGDWNVTAGGDYTFAVSCSNIFWLFIDGKKVVDLSPGDNFTQKRWTVPLKPGVHRVKAVNCFSSELRFSTVYVEGPGMVSKEPLDDLAARSAAH